MLELWAVDLPELHDLHDVIVFSTRGERTFIFEREILLDRWNFLGPDFNKIAGSDLDGDGYFVSEDFPICLLVHSSARSRSIGAMNYD